MTVVPPIVERLEIAAREGGGRVIFHGDDGADVLDATRLYDMARRRAAVLRERGVSIGDRIGIIGPNKADWVAWMHAVWMCGGVGVGLPIPIRIRDRAAVADNINALVTAFEVTQVAAETRYVPLLAPAVAIDWADADATAPLDADELVRIDDDDHLARIIPTSGTTAMPKGVGRSYTRTNYPTINDSMNPFGFDEMRYLSYAPLAHAGAWMTQQAHFHPWLEVHVLSPHRFARDPGELFRLVGPNRIMATSGTSSAIAAALRSIERRPDGVDLSSMEWLSFSYEMVDPDVVLRLVEAGPRFGLRPGSIAASYGLSEGGGTHTPVGRPPRIDVVDLDALVAQGVARAPTANAAVKRVVSCGAESWMEVRVADDDGQRLPDRHVGEVQFRGSELMVGYVGPGSHDAFVAGEWMHTGDAGYLADGELYITGRIKEVIVQQGKKYHPEDIEWAAAHGANVPPDRCVAFTPVDAGDGEIVVAIELGDVGESEEPHEVERSVRAAVLNRVGVSVRSVVFVDRESLPKASTGKAQRLAARDRHAEGNLATTRLHS